MEQNVHQSPSVSTQSIFKTRGVAINMLGFFQRLSPPGVVFEVEFLCYTEYPHPYCLCFYSEGLSLS